MARRYYYSRSDRRAILCLALLAVGISVALLLFHDNGSTATVASADSVSVDSVSRHYGTKRRSSQPILEQRQQLFAFDPNTADSTALLALGLQRWQVANIYKYRSRGGVYRKPSDFARLYGLTVHQYKRLEPYIRISPDFIAPASSLFPTDTIRTTARPQRYVSSKIKVGDHIDVNVGDTAQLKSVPGIGSYFARKIVQYGQRLGGYVSVSQLDEIEDFPSEAKSFFVVGSDPNPKSLNVNKLTFVQLRRHPYISYYQARSIVDYRRLNGPFRSLDDLSSLPDFTPADIQRLAPYVAF